MTRIMEGSGTSACALTATLLLETLALRKTLVNRDITQFTLARRFCNLQLPSSVMAIHSTPTVYIKVGDR